MDHKALQQALLQAFLEEAPELLEKMQTALFEMEADGSTEVSARIDALKRPVHSLKGAASAIGNTAVRDLCHYLEEGLAGRKTARPTEQELDLYHDVVKWLRAAIDQPTVTLDVGDLTSRLLALAQAEVSDTDSSGSAVISFGEPAQVAEETPTDVIPPASAVIRLQDGNAEPLPPAAPHPVRQTIRVALPKIERLQSINGEIISIRLRQEEHASALRSVLHATADFEHRHHALAHLVRGLRGDTDKRTRAQVESTFASLSGQIRTIKRELFRLSSAMTNQNGQLSLLSDAMDDGVRSVRMMPVAPFLESFRATVREAARALGKDVVLDCHDSDVEIDRLIIDDLKDPLTHLVRNAVSHGIEPSEVRNRRGKPSQGRIELSAALEGEYVALTIRDDGAGFDCAAIHRKAVNLGLASENDVLDAERLLEIVCTPGLSTNDNADMVSGRGVGMDVVASRVRSLGGFMTLTFEPGQGSCFRILVPSTVATAHGLVLSLGAHRFGIVLDAVERIERCAIADLTLVDQKPVLYVQGQPVSIISLESLLQLAESSARNPTVRYPVVIVRTGVQRLAVMVDDILGEIPVVVNPLGPQFDHMRLFTGGAILPDGKVLPIIDARSAIDEVSQRPTLRIRAEEAAGDESGKDEDAAPREATRSILVVDDSITTRTLERNILQACGYRVAVATDGLEALDILNVEDDIAMVVTDMEMPRMDGIELCRNIRAGRHRNLPIVMVTSVGDEVERQRGLDAGADAYIIKGQFEQDHFLATIRRFVNG